MCTSAYYNEFDPKAAAWLRQLIKNGNITPGEVDERSITEVNANELIGFDRVHFFAGIGTWDYCLNQSGWGDRPIWTASLPCQPFSAAGKVLGKSDERHLLPHFIELVRQCKPATLFGEQVSAAIRHGWLDDLYAEMEACDYAIGSAIIGAHSVGAAHIRQRLYWVANSVGDGDQRTFGRINGEANSSKIVDRPNVTQSGESCGAGANVCGMADTISKQQEQPNERPSSVFGASMQSEECVAGSSDIRATSYIDWIYCRDNKYRPVKSGIKPLVDGIARGMVYSSDSSEPINANATQEARVMRLKGYGNAIQAQTAMAFINAYMSIK